MNDTARIPASFRDPQGFLFNHGETLLRQVNQAGQVNYDTLMGSGLYQQLVASGLLIAHHEVDSKPFDNYLAYKVIQPDHIRFISYPYEWCFSQLKDAALTTLRIQKLALDHGMSLQDASAYNIQFQNGKPLLIDTLSFQVYEEGVPWTAYRQFCQHFLAPLALMAYTDIRLSQLLKIYLDGIPLDLAASLLPFKVRLMPALYLHIFLHAKSQSRYAGKPLDKDKIKTRMSKVQLLGLISNLESAVRKLHWRALNTDWVNYYSQDHNYTPVAMQHKVQIVSEFLERIAPNSLWDLGANTGDFSRLVTDRGISTIGFDVDPGAVELNYLHSKNACDNNMLPLVLDLTNPSPSIGWQNQERMSLLQRGPVDAVLALALVHHLAIANNVPFIHLAEFYSRLSRWLVIEFVPKSDSQVQKMLSTRRDVFDEYSLGKFESSFCRLFNILCVENIKDSCRSIYLMKNKVEI